VKYRVYVTVKRYGAKKPIRICLDEDGSVGGLEDFLRYLDLCSNVEKIEVIGTREEGEEL